MNSFNGGLTLHQDSNLVWVAIDRVELVASSYGGGSTIQLQGGYSFSVNENANDVINMLEVRTK